MKAVILSLALSLPAFFATTTQAQTTVLDKYIQEGFEHNLVLQQKNISLDKAMYSLKNAQSLYLPTVNFMFDYQTADGGRNIPLPLGDLLNGVYSTLNQLTASNSFPQLKNESINFLPKNFYDGKIRTTIPIINTDIGYNKQIQQQQVTLQEYEVEVYKRELVKSIKTAYFNYLMAAQAVGIYQASLQMAQESKRVNEKLLENGKGLPAYVLRSESETENINAQISEAQQQTQNARLYFNALLNREATAEIDNSYDTEAQLQQATQQLGDSLVNSAREEIKQVQQLITLNQTVVKMNQQYRVPKLNGFLDLGSQSQDWKFNGQSRYYMAGVSLSVPLYAGNRNNLKIKQSQLDVKNAEVNKALLLQQISVSTGMARNNLYSAWRTCQATLKQQEAAATYFRLIDKGYKAGTNTFIETVDARSQLTHAQLAITLNRYKVLIAAASLERENASYPINNK
ncbi:Outer membrane protein TolC [Filimonas lacunae]|uniref:Outer membrane protein TolC n=1 Tax=Filimonas lacunae TaxID=477680 RepID=A0A173MJD9_9BACT|nr:TolC family protein [Filimonas lacunae]BAV07508.1 cobalt-zinc-cadmium resistance protein CzcA [Filimonas lacunae]SIT30143.1 Outer membrane protein TolC [Filimonas lacunae]